MIYALSIYRILNLLLMSYGSVRQKEMSGAKVLEKFKKCPLLGAEFFRDMVYPHNLSKQTGISRNGSHS